MHDTHTMANMLLGLLGLAAAAASPAAGCELSITSFGAKAGVNGSSAAFTNSDAINRTLAAAVAQGPGCVVVVPAGRFVAYGGMSCSGLQDTVVRIDGELVAEFSVKDWPGCSPAAGQKQKCASFLSFSAAKNLTITSSNHWPLPFPAVPAEPLDLSSRLHPLRHAGVIDGQGDLWWAWKLATGKKAPSPLIQISDSQDVLLEQLQLLSAPSFHVMSKGSRDVEVRYLDIFVDRKVQRRIRAEAAQRLAGSRDAPAGAAGAAAAAGGGGLLSPFPPQNPAWLNTDGIDPAGSGYHIHNCAIVNDDDSVAVKPTNSGPNPLSVTCSENMLIEDMVMTGVGASLGSVTPHVSHNCVRNITFKNVTMPGTTKGIYIKSNPGCLADGSKTAEITDVTYEDFRILKPEWWSVWIGPQQQHEPKSALGDKCALDYPITDKCPTQGCVTFSDIVLRDVAIHDPVLGSPGVILGNSSNPMR